MTDAMTNTPAFDDEMPERTHLFKDKNGIWSAFPDRDAAVEYIRADQCIPASDIRPLVEALNKSQCRLDSLHDFISEIQNLGEMRSTQIAHITDTMIENDKALAQFQQLHPEVMK